MPPWARLVGFSVCALFCYGGAVNLGPTDVTAALPFLVLLLVAMRRWGRGFQRAGLAVLLACTVLWVLKHRQATLFYPPLGREFSFPVDQCLTRYRVGHDAPTFVLAGPQKAGIRCEDWPGDDIERTQDLAAHQPLRVASVRISGLSESYSLQAETTLGQLSVNCWSNDPDQPYWTDTRQSVTADDCRRAVFYQPSQLMYWPMLPVALYTWLSVQGTR